MTDVATPEAESAQALFCYIADVIGASKIEKAFEPYLNGEKSVNQFIEQYNKTINEGYSTGRVDTSKSKDVVLKYLKAKNDWFISSLSISKKLIKDLSSIDSDFSKIKTPGWQSLFYKHGDKEIADTMAKLFKSANNQTKKSVKGNGATYFGNINKWSPADIYFGSRKAIDELKKLLNDPETKKENLTFALLNETIGDLIDSADLLPLSLKKVKTQVILKPVNFDRKYEQKLIANTICTGIKKWSPMKAKIKTGKNFFISDYPKPKRGDEGGGLRDFYITLNSDKQDGTIQIRHTPASNGKPSKGVKVIMQYKGALALGGQFVGFDRLSRIISSVNKSVGDDLMRTWDKNYNEFEKIANAYITNGGGAKLYRSTKKEDKTKFNDDMGALSGITVMNAVRPKLDKFFSKKGESQNNVVRAIFEYTTSRTEMSSPFVIAKN